jgi:hypothetical protein
MYNKEKNFIYSVHPAVVMLEKWARDLPKSTGKNLEEWVNLVKQSDFLTEIEQREWLKTEFKLGANYARWIVERVWKKGFEDSDGLSYLQHAPLYVENMFAGKPSLWPIYEAVVEKVQQLGSDVKICPCKTVIPFYRNHVFAQAKPSTKTRLDLGLALPSIRVRHRLIETGGLTKGDRITHRIPLTNQAGLDEEALYWLKIAYQMDAIARSR